MAETGGVMPITDAELCEALRLGIDMPPEDVDAIAADRLESQGQEIAALRDGYWKAEGQAHTDPCAYGSLCPWCEIARLTTEHGHATDEPDPTGTTHARLNWWKQRCDEARERHAAESAIRWAVQQIDQNVNAGRLVADYQKGEK
jgi:hypothetical protein